VHNPSEPEHFLKKQLNDHPDYHLPIFKFVFANERITKDVVSFVKLAIERSSLMFNEKEKCLKYFKIIMKMVEFPVSNLLYDKSVINRYDLM